MHFWSSSVVRQLTADQFKAAYAPPEKSVVVDNCASFSLADLARSFALLVATQHDLSSPTSGCLQCSRRRTPPRFWRGVFPARRTGQKEEMQTPGAPPPDSARRRGTWYFRMVMQGTKYQDLELPEKQRVRQRERGGGTTCLGGMRNVRSSRFTNRSTW